MLETIGEPTGPPQPPQWGASDNGPDFTKIRRVLHGASKGLAIRLKQWRERGEVMKIITYDRFRPGVTMETIQPFLPQEVANVWRLWKAGIVRENYARADEPGVVIVFECDSVEECKRYTDDFPLTKAGLLEWFFIPVQVPLPIEALFRDEVDTKEPYDRTLTPAARQ